MAKQKSQKLEDLPNALYFDSDGCALKLDGNCKNAQLIFVKSVANFEIKDGDVVNSGSSRKIIASTEIPVKALIKMLDKLKEELNKDK